MSYSFPDGSAVVTGAAAGIGRATAERLAAAGLHVVGLDINADPGPTERSFEATVDDGSLVVGDVTDRQDVETALERAQAEGPIRSVVTCAGIGATGGVSHVDRADLRRAFAVHVEGTYEVLRQVLPELCQRGQGSVVTTSSIAAWQGWPGTVDYAPAKGAIEALTRAVASEVSPDGVRVNGVAPGFVRTGMNADVWHEEVTGDRSGRVDMDTVESRTLLPRLGDPVDVAAVIAFLASEDAAFVTGQVLPVDGGWTVNAW